MKIILFALTLSALATGAARAEDLTSGLGGGFDYAAMMDFASPTALGTTSLAPRCVRRASAGFACGSGDLPRIVPEFVKDEPGAFRQSATAIRRPDGTAVGVGLDVWRLSESGPQVRRPAPGASASGR